MADVTALFENAVCYITGALGQGSGVLISPDCVLTAAHVVYGSGATIVASSLTVTPGYNSGIAPFGTYSVSAISSNAVSIRTAVDSERDFAVLHLSAPVTGINYMTLGTGFAGGVATVSGYPAIAFGGQTDQLETVVDVPGRSLIEFTALGQGSSGGPIWTGSAADAHVVGVISSVSVTSPTIGFAGLISEAAARQIMSWVSIFDAPAPPSPAAPLAAVTQNDTASARSTAPVFRLMNTATGGHFYTASAGEADAARASGSFTTEANSFGEFAPNAADSTTCAVYRFFDTHDGGHMLTASVTERDTLLATRHDLVFEGVALNEHKSAQAGDQAVYRFFDKVDGGHFFTANAAEFKAAMGNGSLSYEGIAFYAPSA